MEPVGGRADDQSGRLALAVQTPIGAAIDAAHRKREAIALALAVLGAGALCIYMLPNFRPVLIALAAPFLGLPETAPASPAEAEVGPLEEPSLDK